MKHSFDVCREDHLHVCRLTDREGMLEKCIFYGNIKEKKCNCKDLQVQFVQLKTAVGISGLEIVLDENVEIIPLFEMLCKEQHCAENAVTEKYSIYFSARLGLFHVYHHRKRAGHLAFTYKLQLHPIFFGIYIIFKRVFLHSKSSSCLVNIISSEKGIII